MTDIDKQLKSLMANLFQCSESQLTDDTGPGDINGWDSLGHVALMSAIQQHFGTHIPVEDAIEVESIADIVALLEKAGAAAR
ncbi:MAG TPA: acyl carrier protein [Gammaproteobacteria bacterium]